MAKIIASILLTTCWLYSSAQDTAANYKGQKDAIDVLYSILGKDATKRLDTAKIQPGKVYFSGAPGIAYSLATGAAVVFASKFAFYTGDANATKISSVHTSFAYTQKKQFLSHIHPDIWTRHNTWNFIGDYRYLKYPQKTYGIGGNTSLDDGYLIDYSYLRFYQYALRKIGTDLYAGLGYQLDYHWNIKEVDPAAGAVTDFEKYGFKKTSASSGLSLNILYNNIRNNINPEPGFYANLILRQNLSWLGSDRNWNSMLVDVRKYFPVGQKSNILGFWTYDWLTLSGNPPYLDLPSNGWDSYGNTARGYVQSRFAGKKMLYVESEYRFGITRNGLFGGVVFANAASYAGFTNKFEGIEPAAGLGMRVKFNKFSRTNVAVDYAFGKGGSKGVFINLGEVF